MLRLGVSVGLLLAAALTSAAAGPAAVSSDLAGDGYNPANPPRMGWAWTQLVPDGVQVRYATPEATCPFVVETIGTSTQRHQLVPEFQVGAYPSTATLCARRVNPAATAARIDTSGVGVPVHPDPQGNVPIPGYTQPNPARPRPASIAVIGDTGCRIPASGPMQRCDAQGWPLAEVTDSAATKPVPPDLAVHVGDYLYRTSPRRQPTDLCGAAGLGNNAHTWGCLVTDFFLPAEELLGRAPFVFVRGNHENCGRGGEAWFRYLAAEPSTTACTSNPPQDFSPPERIRAGSLTLLNMDTSCASDEGPAPTCDRGARLARYTAEFDTVNANVSGDTFLLSHTPLWAVHGRTANDNPLWIDELLDDAIRASGLQQLNPGIGAVLSGHVHLYQALDFGGAAVTYRPPQLTVGASGTTLDPKDWVDSQLVGKDVDRLPLGQLITRREWGYAVLSRPGAAWHVGFHDRAGNPVAGTDCDLGVGQFVNCQ
ncbi:hypothetical protein Asi02nite_57690 [Asanoa siamensis]|uniref:Calcineurin-like phosphoesterase domain-containing protein n=1 Tax=Asanoa siamensis TaxID=926357 RepID=A0ABQ4CYB8_9ACTN|nr:hypothetical protein Asi02nite_57690 [Asanoa siamensis]